MLHVIEGGALRALDEYTPSQATFESDGIPPEIRWPGINVWDPVILAEFRDCWRRKGALPGNLDAAFRQFLDVRRRILDTAKSAAPRHRRQKGGGIVAAVAEFMQEAPSGDHPR